MEIGEQLRQYSGWALKTRILSSKFDESLRRQNRRLRPSTAGFSLISDHPDTPQMGFSGLREDSDLVRYLSKPLAFPGRPTPEKSLQSFLIREAFYSAGRLPSLEAVLGDELWFVMDELAFTAAGAKRVADLLLVRVRSGRAELYQAELKSVRAMKEAFGQVLAFRPLMEGLKVRDQWRELAAILTGRRFNWANGFAGSLGLVVWPRSQNPASSLAFQRRSSYPGIDAVGYEKLKCNEFTFSIER